jgi:peptidoglycan/xylan/chitin deacetylase (PgdA/CDA1 family)
VDESADERAVGSAASVTSQLDRLLAPQTEARVRDGRGRGPACWLQAGSWRLFARPRDVDTPSGDEIAQFVLPTGATVKAVRENGDGAVWVPFDLDEAYANYVSETWREGVTKRSLTITQLRAYYAAKRLIPRRLQLAARRAYTRRLALPEFPAWPLDDSVSLLLRFYALCLLLAAGVETISFRWFWPKDFHAAAILTHDVEGADGLRLALAIANLEEERGFRSSFNVVGSSYPVDRGILRELQVRGFEIGLHGLRHDRSLFSSRRAFEAQLPKIAETARAFGAQGFRSPSTHRNHGWLAELPLSYDCSVPHSDPYEPIPGGCCSLWPYFIGDLVELPYTLPQDHTLLTVLSNRSIDVWVRQVDAITQRHGLVQCLSHPDPGYLGDPDKRALYAELLDALAERPRLWKPLPRELAHWWRERDAETSAERIAYGSIRRSDDGAFADLEPPT